MAGKRKKTQDETIEIFYGINPNTFEVESVHLGHDGVLRAWSADGISGTHFVMGGRKARSEVHIVWGLTDVISVSPFLTEEQRDKKVAELRALAAEKKPAKKTND